MKKFRLTIPIFASATVEIFAENKEEAKDKARIPNLCHQCAHIVSLNDFDFYTEIEVEEIE